ncbi:putative spermidine/putrescine transport atp-binding abc transporter protein [Oceanicola granulosus HTCC2516]|uniref:Putative spermidine/putrescine transport atp-binding abc transporter protein n=1 Tax=Oceanicola granulosus (strain ATCC BAA-861 / DSM 15982 / KCTC 12143 / HTCC2516) TaxID=314256 RepID=Q2CC48_OCEGH|nr:ABC transporter ATP-binding protein [Oceanicola granulosus]EAR50233.1 putative spermidine/putrescine transport atp-binding abc transporter protein [Oceanicola granulosus HTCC2516]
MTELSLRGLTKRFGNHTAVDDVTLDVPDGSFICLLGPSGCGKTTLLRLLAGLEEPTAGEVSVAGQDQTNVPPEKREFGMVFQSLALFPHLSVADNVAYPLSIRGRPRAESRKRADELLAQVQLAGMGDRRIHQLSGGQRQRVAIARGLAIEPKVFLLDEPLSALDANLREQMQVELRQLQQRLGVTTVVVTHDQKEALTMADIVIVMDKGRVQQVGAPMEVYRDPANAFVAGFIGTSNLLPCELTDASSLTLSGQRLALDPADRVKCSPGQPAVLSVRPEDTRLGPAGEGLEARVVFIRDLGESTQFVLDHDGTEITALYAPDARSDLKVDDRVGLGFVPGKRVVLPA